MFGFRGIERHSQCQKRICQPLHTNPDRSMTHVGTTGLDNRIIIDIDYFVEIECNDFSNIVQLLEIKFAVIDKGRQGNTCKVTYCNLIWSRVLDNLGTKIRTFNRSEILLIRFTITCVLVQHERIASFGLSLENSVPEFLRLDRLACTTFFFVFSVQSFEFVAVDFMHVGCFVGTE